MHHVVRQTLLWLGAGVVLQRVLQLVTFLLVGQALGVEGLGRFGQGQAVAALLTALATTGVRNLAARAMANAPGAAAAAVRRAIAARLRLGAALAAAGAAVAFTTTAEPWFWTLWALQAVPAAFDLKNLLDAIGRTRGEVLLEAGASAAQFVLLLAWLSLPDHALWQAAAIVLACRTVYAIGAARLLRRLPQQATAATAATAALQPTPGRGPIAVAQTAHELLCLADVLLVALLLGDRVAGLYALASRFAAAALLPSAQLARLLLPHSLRAHRGGDTARTFATALRVTLLTTAPMLAGGLVVATGLCRLSGEDFVAAAPTLRLLLLAGCLQHVGWQCSHTLLAAHQDRAYAHGLGWPSALHVLLLLAAALAGGPAPLLALLAALAAALAQGTYATIGLLQTRAHRADEPLHLAQPLLIAAAVAIAAALPLPFADGAARLAAQVAAGGVALGLLLWRTELRGRWRRLGDGLCRASGFQA
ncbi:MAG: hypothetical protein IT455_08260 [Planctomycetes bacterium]|nr:hypothetical protein [Planctomycetota bacterium]